MTFHRNEARSEYIHWAKTSASVRLNFAGSGVLPYPLEEEIGIRLGDLQANGPIGYGYGALTERVANKCGVSPNQVVQAAGTSMANHLVMAALLDSGDEALIEEPCYDPLLAVADYLGAKVRRLPRRFEQGFRIDTDELKRNVTSKTRLIAITNLHNPSGAFTDEQTLREIGNIADSVGARVLVDEVYLEMVFDGSAGSAVHLGGQFVATGSLTKAYGLSGLRCGWILAPPKLAERIWRLNDLFGVNAPHPTELLSVLALDHLAQIRARSAALLKVNRLALKQFLNGRADLEFFLPTWGTICFPRLRRSSNEFCDLLRAKYETRVVPGKFFEMPQHFRIGIGGDSEMTKRGFEKLAEALDEWHQKYGP